MLKQYAYFYFTKRDAENIRRLVPDHIAYWKAARPFNYSGGPFSDRSGGLILFEAENMAKAETLALEDPFVTGKVVESRWVKEWRREE